MSTPQSKGQISSRVMNMKFMQRASAAASPANSTYSTSGSSSAKRIRLTVASTPAASPLARQIEQKLTEEELRLQKTLEQQAAEAGETQWTLNIRNSDRSSQRVVQVVQASFADLESLSDESDEEYTPQVDPSVPKKAMVAGRMSFGKIPLTTWKGSEPISASSNNRYEAINDHDEEDEDHDDGNGEIDDGDDYDPTTEYQREEQKKAGEAVRQKRAARKHDLTADSNRLADLRRKRKVKLNGISANSGPISARSMMDTPRKVGTFRDRDRVRKDGGFNGDNRTCYKCGRTGHVSAVCPKR